MKVLLICSGNRGSVSPFIEEQAKFIRNKGVDITFFRITGKGYKYLSSLPRLQKTLKENNFDLIHAHSGLSGMVAVLQKKVPVVITFHGCDIGYEKPWNVIGYCGECRGCSIPIIIQCKLISKFASKLAAFNIIVEESQAQRLSLIRDYAIIPCGVDFETFYEIPKQEARQKLMLPLNDNFVLFSGSINNIRKNYALARKAVDNICGVKLVELRNYTRDEVNLLMNAADIQIVTSLYETGPLVVKEAMACNTPIVTTEVGDVRKVIGNTAGCYITGFDYQDISEKIKLALSFGRKTKGREKIHYLDNNIIATKVISVYKKVLRTN